MGLILLPGRTISIPHDLKIIDDDVAFEIDDGQGGKSWFVIEPDAKLRKDETYIAPDNEIAQKAGGLASNDTIDWGGHHATWTVVAIKHKYLHALHRSMVNFERYFPTTQGLRQVRIDTEAEEPFKELFKDVRGRHDYVQRVFDILDENLIPIHVAASALSGDIIETRYGLQSTGGMHRVCTGTNPERIQAIEALRSNAARGCVIDALTLNVIRRLGIEHVVRKVCGPIGVTGSTRDLYWSRLQEMKEAGGPSMNLYWQDGQYYRYEASQEEWNAALQVRDADLSWIDENATIVPAVGATDPPGYLRQLNDYIELNFIDDMLAAHGTGRLLLCQDKAYRVIAEQFLGVKGSWLQPLLMHARDEKLLSDGQYVEAVKALIQLGDRFISIDSGVLLAAARHEENPFDRFGLVARQLGGADADILSHIRVTVEFLGVVWSKQPRDLTTAKQTSMVLENLLRGRSDWCAVISVLRRLFHECFARNAEFDRHLLLWLQGHFLVPFGTSTLPPVRLERS